VSYGPMQVSKTFIKCRVHPSANELEAHVTQEAVSQSAVL